MKAYRVPAGVLLSTSSKSHNKMGVQGVIPGNFLKNYMRYGAF